MVYSVDDAKFQPYKGSSPTAVTDDNQGFLQNVLDFSKEKNVDPTSFTYLPTGCKTNNYYVGGRQFLQVLANDRLETTYFSEESPLVRKKQHAVYAKYRADGLYSGSYGSLDTLIEWRLLPERCQPSAWTAAFSHNFGGFLDELDSYYKGETQRRLQYTCSYCSEAESPPMKIGDTLQDNGGVQTNGVSCTSSHFLPPAHEDPPSHICRLWSAATWSAHNLTPTNTVVTLDCTGPGEAEVGRLLHRQGATVCGMSPANLAGHRLPVRRQLSCYPPKPAVDHICRGSISGAAFFLASQLIKKHAVT